MTTTLGQSVSEKLSRENYILWKAQVLAAVRGAPSFLLNSVTKEVLGQVTTGTSAADAWCTIVGMFSSQSRA
jgi:hypothetical protein